MFFSSDMQQILSIQDVFQNYRRFFHRQILRRIQTQSFQLKLVKTIIGENVQFAILYILIVYWTSYEIFYKVN